MTERKPLGMSWQSWIDRQIETARSRGEFDDLPGTGKPIADIDRPHDELWWVRQKLKREGVEYLPPAIAIRKEAADAEARAVAAPTDAEARAIIDEINAKIRHLNSTTVAGPPTTIGPIPFEEVVEARRARQDATIVDRARTAETSTDARDAAR